MEKSIHLIQCFFKMVLASILVFASLIANSQTTNAPKRFSFNLLGGPSFPLGDYANDERSILYKSGHAKTGYFVELGIKRWTRPGLGFGLSSGIMQHAFRTKSRPCGGSLGGLITLTDRPWQIPYAIPSVLLRMGAKANFMLELGAGPAHLDSFSPREDFDTLVCSKTYNHWEFPSKWVGLMRIGAGFDAPITPNLLLGVRGIFYYTEYNMNGRQRSGVVGIFEEEFYRTSNIKLPIFNFGASIQYRL